ncbi:DNA-binding PucR family transcriptional regulator [Prauserella shujinwangii]|uniref:DNA-binding PucR family transcriptional regulator n=1 Tax=Prauserella shujinwangii TaxID=1453103 RepID=A0A2T0M0G4_9PSEU|nr:helix-turn-helix domain-containing protein [Prauserella shujinwangii]PRX50079.1 DNA-binding PucR family transcriptional regulator [Prauserella shujinwangii]
MADEDVQALVDELAEQLHRSVAIDDPSVRLLAASRHFGDEDPLRVTAVLNRSLPDELTRPVLELGISTWTEPGRVELDVPGAKARLCTPVRSAGRLLGFLWLIDDGPVRLTEHEIEMAARTAARAGVLLHRDLLVRERSRARRRSILRELVSADEAARAAAAEELAADQLFGEQPMHYQVVAAHHCPATSAEAAHDIAVEVAVEDGLRAQPECAGLVFAHRSRAWLLLARPQEPTTRFLHAVAQRMTARFRALSGPDARLAVGIGAPVTDLGLVVNSYRQALLAVRAARLVPALGEVARWGSLGPYDILLRIPTDELVRAADVPPLARLQAADNDQQVLMGTLETFLDNAGDVKRTADLLCVHRGTLYYRIRRIEQLTGCDLRDGDDRLMLHMGLKLRGLAAAGRCQS